LGYDTSTLRSKSWKEFTRADAPQLDFILTVCDNAAAETCPVWPGKPATAHWGIADPAASDGNASEIAKAFEDTYRELLARVGLLVAFPLDSLDPATIRSDLQRIGTIEGATAKAQRAVTDFSLARRLAAEGLGTAFLLATVIGSGVMAFKLAGGNGALALLCNTIPTGAILTVLILTFGPLSGAHFNPVVTIAFALRGELLWSVAALYIAAQLIGAVIGVWAAHLMFELPVWQFSATVRSGLGQWIAEAVATFGLVLVILGCLARLPASVPYAVGLYITAAYWFTASTSFANPAVTIARSLSDTFAGIAPPGVLAFIVSQICGALLAVGLARWLWAEPRSPGATS
jgi:glycerol uptake facilitator-like aquaporin